ncbi:hypothetical protein HK105_208076 [Polyrhizophydium stewartii]|uniref:Uncharacterized protein n=1 Tax=Polyrhizophydium stewartii TaxID=2732419 RepID=A0ABR4MYS1_9FUNG
MSHPLCNVRHPTKSRFCLGFNSAPEGRCIQPAKTCLFPHVCARCSSEEHNVFNCPLPAPTNQD